MSITLTIGDTVLPATLLDTPAGRAFGALLPLTLTLSYYASTEKVSDLPTRLPTDKAPAGAAADVGDITYYAPWGNLAIFYRNFGHAAGLVRLGRLRSGVDQLATLRDDVPVTIEVVPSRTPASEATRPPTGTCNGRAVVDDTGAEVAGAAKGSLPVPLEAGPPSSPRTGVPSVVASSRAELRSWRGAFDVASEPTHEGPGAHG